MGQKGEPHQVRRLNEEEKREIFDMIQSGKQDHEIIEYFKKHRKRNKKTIMLYVTAFRYLLNPTTRSKRLNGKRIGYGVSDATLDRLRPVVEEFMADDASANGLHEWKISPHIASLLKARDRLADQVQDLPTPEEVVDYALDKSKELEPPGGLFPGCLGRYQLPPGRIINEPTYRYLCQHTQNDPHWDGLSEDIGDTRLLWDSPWWREYIYDYISRTLNLVETSRMYITNRIGQAQEALGNRSYPLITNYFVGTPIKEALRSAMGLPPLVSPTQRIRYETRSGSCASEHGTGYSIFYNGELIAEGVDDRPLKMFPEGARDGAVTGRIIEVHREFTEQILRAPDILEIIRTWHNLQNRAREFASWLRSLSAEYFARTKCSLCDNAVSGPFYNH